MYVAGEVMISSIEHARDLLRARSHAGIAPRPLYLLPLLRMGGLAVALTREAADLGWAGAFGVPVHSLEERTARRGKGSARRARAELTRMLPELVGTDWQGREFRAASYGRHGAGLSEWEDAFVEVGARLRVGGWHSGLPIPEDKIGVREWFAGLGVRTPLSVVAETLDYPSLRRRLGSVIVAQRPTGSGGKGTYLMRGAATAPTVPGRWLVSEYVGDTTLNVHGFVGADRLHALPPSVQIGGVEEIGASFGRYAGSDFAAAAALPASVLDGARDAILRVGAELGRMGYRGVFGIDFAVRNGTAYALEINCRMQGSTWLLGELELAGGELPTMARHVLEGQGLRTGPVRDPLSVRAVQLVVRHTGEPARLVDAPAGGVYRLDGGVARRERDGFGLLESGPGRCAVVNVPAPGTAVGPQAILARLVGTEPLTAPDGRSLNEAGRRWVDAIRASFSLVPIESPRRRAC
jgi:hypothetical protein